MVKGEARLKAKKGYILVYVLCIMAFGIIIVTPLLHYVGTTYDRYKSDSFDSSAYYTADALMEIILNDMCVGTNISVQNQSGNYSKRLTNGWLNGYNASATINTTPHWTAPPSMPSGNSYSVTTTAWKGNISKPIISITAALHDTDTLVYILTWQVDWSPQ